MISKIHLGTIKDLKKGDFVFQTEENKFQITDINDFHISIVGKSEKEMNLKVFPLSNLITDGWQFESNQKNLEQVL